MSVSTTVMGIGSADLGVAENARSACGTGGTLRTDRPTGPCGAVRPAGPGRSLRTGRSSFPCGPLRPHGTLRPLGPRGLARRTWPQVDRSRPGRSSKKMTPRVLLGS